MGYYNNGQAEDRMSDSEGQTVNLSASSPKKITANTLIIVLLIIWPILLMICAALSHQDGYVG